MESEEILSRRGYGVEVGSLSGGVNAGRIGIRGCRFGLCRLQRIRDLCKFGLRTASLALFCL